LFIKVAESPHLDPVPKTKPKIEPKTKESEQNLAEASSSNVSPISPIQEDEKDLEKVEGSMSNLNSPTPPVDSSPTPQQQGYRRNGRRNYRANNSTFHQPNVEHHHSNFFKQVLPIGSQPTLAQEKLQNFIVPNPTFFSNQNSNPHLVPGGGFPRSHHNVRNTFSTPLKDCKVNTPKVNLTSGNQNGDFKNSQSTSIKNNGERRRGSASTNTPRKTYSTPLKDCGTSSRKNVSSPSVVETNPRHSVSTPFEDCRE
jgi:hypothetical protein